MIFSLSMFFLFIYDEFCRILSLVKILSHNLIVLVIFHYRTNSLSWYWPKSHSYESNKWVQNACAGILPRHVSWKLRQYYDYLLIITHVRQWYFPLIPILQTRIINGKLLGKQTGGQTHLHHHRVNSGQLLRRQVPLWFRSIRWSLTDFNKRIIYMCSQ